MLAFVGPDMATDGWQTRASAWLQHLATVAAGALSWLPGWAVAVLLVAGTAVLLRRATRTRSTSVGPLDEPSRDHAADPVATTAPEEHR